MATSIVINLAIEDVQRRLAVIDSTDIEMTTNQLQYINKAIHMFGSLKTDSKLAVTLLRFEQWLYIMNLYEVENLKADARSLKRFFIETMTLNNIHYEYANFLRHDRYLTLVSKFGTNILLIRGKWLTQTVLHMSSRDFSELLKSPYYEGSDIFETFVKRNGCNVQAIPNVIRIHDSIKDKITQNAITVSHINERLGFGVFATRFIRQKTIIGVYVGEHFKNATIHERFIDENIRKGIKDLNGMRRGQSVIDATYFGTRTKFVNHSIKFNCQAVPEFYNGTKQICFITCEDIEKDAQVFISYGEFELISNFE